MSAEVFWELVHAAPYEARVAEALGLERYETVERSEDADAVYRRIAVAGTLSAGLAATLRRLGVEPAARYEEEQWRSKRERAVRFRIHPPVLAERVRVEGDVRVEPLAAGRCRRTLDAEVRVRIPVLGGRLERAVADAAERAYARATLVAEEMARERS